MIANEAPARLSPERLAEIRALHVKLHESDIINDRYEEWDTCQQCSDEDWPCKTAALVAEIDRLTAENPTCLGHVPANPNAPLSEQRCVRCGQPEPCEVRRMWIRWGELSEAVRAFVQHHENGQAGQPGHPKTYGEQDVWLAEWDRLISLMKARTVAAGTTSADPEYVAELAAVRRQQDAMSEEVG